MDYGYGANQIIDMHVVFNAIYTILHFLFHVLFQFCVTGCMAVCMSKNNKTSLVYFVSILSYHFLLNTVSSITCKILVYFTSKIRESYVFFCKMDIVFRIRIFSTCTSLSFDEKRNFIAQIRKKLRVYQKSAEICWQRNFNIHVVLLWIISSLQIKQEEATL